MKKILSFALALLFSWSMFAQDAYLQDFTTAPSDWSMANESSWQFYTQWGEALSVSDVGQQSTDDAYPYLYSPVFTLSSANNGGNVCFYTAAYNLDETGQVANSAAFFILYAIIDGETIVNMGSDSVNSTRYYMKYESFPLSTLELDANNHTVQFVIHHFGQDYAPGALEIDDFVVRKRADAFIIQFLPDPNENATGSMNYMVTGEGGTLTAPQCGYSVQGKHFAYWYTQDSHGNEFGIEANEPVSEIDEDMYWYAVFEDGESGGGDPQTDVWTVTFNSNGGQGTMDPISFDKNSSDNWFNPSSVTCTFTRTGYHFVGWSTSPTGAVEYAEINVNRDMTFYAIWEQDSDPLAINDINAANISIYPNPAQGMVRVNGVTINSLDLLDLTGRVVLSSETNTIDLSSLINGVYMLRINANEGTAVRKIVKR